MEGQEGVVCDWNMLSDKNVPMEEVQQQSSEEEEQQQQQHQDEQMESSSSSPQSSVDEKDKEAMERFVSKWISHPKAQNREDEAEFFMEKGKVRFFCKRCATGKSMDANYMWQHSDGGKHLERGGIAAAAPAAAATTKKKVLPPKKKTSESDDSSSSSSSSSSYKKRERSVSVSDSEEEEEEEDGGHRYNDDVIYDIYKAAYDKHYNLTIEQVAAEDAMKDARKRLRKIL